MNDYTATVLGATGKTGARVVELALARGWRVRAGARREPELGEWTPFDWDEPATWTTACRGSDAAYVLIPFRHPGAPERTPELLRHIAAADVPRIVLLSTLDADGAPPTDPSRAAELALEELPVQWAALRPTWFMDNFTKGSFAAMIAAGDLRLPSGDGRIPFVDVRDVAAVAVAALGPDGPTGYLDITGPEAITHHQVATAFTEALGRPVTYRSVSAEEFVDVMTPLGFPLSYSQFLARALTDVATGALRIPVSPTVSAVTGRPAHSIADFAHAHAGRERPASGGQGTV